MADKQGGWVKLYREVWDWQGSPTKRKRPFTKFEAWIWLLTQASHRDHFCGNIKVERGQVLTSLEKLAQIWRRDRKTVRRWVKNMQEFGELSLSYGQSWSLITICKYNEYQKKGPPYGTPDGPSDGTPDGTPNGTQSRRERRERREKNGKKAVPETESKSNIEEFDEWWAGNKPRIREIILNIVYGEDLTGKEVITDWIAAWIKKQLPDIRGWLIADPTRRKKKWAVFVNHWLKKAWKDHLAAGDGPDMTAAQEEAHYADKRRSDTGSGMISIGGIVDDIIEGAKK